MIPLSKQLTKPQTYTVIKTKEQLRDLVNQNKKLIQQNHIQRNVIKNKLISKRIGDQLSIEQLQAAAAPIVESLQQLPSQLVASSPRFPAIEYGDETVTPSKGVSSSQPITQKILQEVHAYQSRNNPTSFEVNIKDGSIGSTGHIDLTNLVERGRIKFKSDGVSNPVDIDVTTGLAYLLLAPYKFIIENDLFSRVITEQDVETYQGIMEAAGVKERSKMASKWKHILSKPVKSTETIGMGIKRKSNKIKVIPTRTYKVGKGGSFGNLIINLPLLRTTNKLNAYKNKKLVLDRMVSDDFIDIISKRHNSKKPYSKESLDTYKELVVLGGVMLSPKKLKSVNNACTKVYYQNLSELSERLDGLRKQAKAGNTSVRIKNEISEILDILHDKGEMDDALYEELYKAYGALKL